MKNKQKSSKVLVTGASGFIGSHLVELLLKKGKKVIALVPYDIYNSTGWLLNIKAKNNYLKIVHGDICDTGLINKLCKEADSVIHLAALISIPYSYEAPASYVQTNIIGTLNILEACRKNNIKKLIHTSTSEVYGSAQYIPIDEDHPLVAQSPYAATKIAADQLVLSYCKSFNLPAVIIRPFNTFGPRQSLRAVIPTIISQILNNKQKIKLGNLNSKRDFTHVHDTALGFYKALISKNILGEVINLGTGYSYSVKEIVQMIEKITNIKIVVIQDKKRIRPKKSEVTNLLSNNKKARKLMGWKLTYGGKDGFKKALKNTIEWFSNPKNLRYYNVKKYTI